MGFCLKCCDFQRLERIVSSLRKRESNKGELKIRISGLSSGIHEYHFLPSPTELGLDARFSKPVEVDAHLDKTSRQMYLKTDVRTVGMFDCDRCLDEFERPLSTRYTVFYLYDDSESGRFPDDEVQIINPDTATIDLTEDVRQMLMLAIPLKLLCTEECKGLCPRCGTNWNHASCNCTQEMIDSRWSGLQNLSK